MTKTKIEQILNEFNNVQPSIKFTIKKEKHKEINYLDITIHRKKKKGLEFSICRKPTQTDIIIPNSLWEPPTLKRALPNRRSQRQLQRPLGRAPPSDS
jgi:hypothetical protein